MPTKLTNFNESTDDLSFSMVQQYCESTIRTYTGSTDYKCALEDLEAIICIAHAYDRLATDLISSSTCDLLHMVHRAKGIYYTNLARYDIALGNDNHDPDGPIVAAQMKEAIESMSTYCHSSSVSFYKGVSVV